MTLLDENVPESARRRMAALGLRVRQVGFEWGRKGMSDDEILAALRGKRRITFLTHDVDFYRRENCHDSYCLVLLAVSQEEMPGYAVRFLKHRSFRTFASRQGKVARVQPAGVVYWELRSNQESEVAWT